MHTTLTPHPVDVVACEVCFKEIPVSEAYSGEASDYIHHYCGLECYALWREQEEKQVDEP